MSPWESLLLGLDINVCIDGNPLRIERVSGKDELIDSGNGEFIGAYVIYMLAMD
jgi:hypothetical protein